MAFSARGSSSQGARPRARTKKRIVPYRPTLRPCQCSFLRFESCWRSVPCSAAGELRLTNKNALLSLCFRLKASSIRETAPHWWGTTVASKRKPEPTSTARWSTHPVSCMQPGCDLELRSCTLGRATARPRACFRKCSPTKTPRFSPWRPLSPDPNL